MFTQKQIDEIAERLSRKAIKDSQFDVASLPFDGTEEIPILQDAENKIITLSDFLNYVIGNEDHSAIECTLTVICQTQGATIKINDVNQSVYSGHYGDVVNVEVSATGYDTLYESITLTKSVEYRVSLNAKQQDIVIPNLGLVSHGTFYTLTIGNTSINVYSKSQVDALIAAIDTGGDGGDEPIDPDPQDTNFLSFSKTSVTLPDTGLADTSASVHSNVDWELQLGE